jgi:hypothetical protein
MPKYYKIVESVSYLRVGGSRLSSEEIDHLTKTNGGNLLLSWNSGLVEQTNWTSQEDRHVEAGILVEVDANKIYGSLSEDKDESSTSSNPPLFTSKAEEVVWNLFWDNSMKNGCPRCGKSAENLVKLRGHKICSSCKKEWDMSWTFDGAEELEEYVNTFLEMGLMED